MKADKSFYVYTLINPINDEPVYVGKGRGRRAYDHGKLSENHPNSGLAAAFTEAKQRGFYDLIVAFEAVGLTEDEAFTLEVEMISYYGRKDLDGGTLVNMTDGGEGMSGHIYGPASRALMSKKAQDRSRSPEARAESSVRLKAALASPEVRAKMSEKAKVRFASEEERKQNGAKIKAAWISPETKAKAAEKLKVRFSFPEARAAMSERGKARCSSPDERARLSKQAKAQMAAPGAREVVSRCSKERMSSPDARKAHGEKVRAAFAARREAKFSAGEYTLEDLRRMEQNRIKMQRHKDRKAGKRPVQLSFCKF